MKQLFKNKQTIIIGIVIAIILLSVCLWFALDSGDMDKGNENPSKPKQEATEDADDELEDSKEEEKKNESGLKVIETPDSTIDSVDGSGMWTGDSSTNKNDNSETTSDKDEKENVLVDDKVWGDVN